MNNDQIRTTTDVVDKLIDYLHKQTGLPVYYLIQENIMCKNSDTKTDCIHFIHWDLHTVAYSTCDHYEKYIMHLDNGCKDCSYYKKREV